MQIETLKSIVAQKELETTKLKQSDAIKTKQINNLEAKLQEAIKTIHQKTSQKETPETSQEPKIPTGSHCLDGNSRMQFLESKTSNLELQYGLLASKFDSFLVSFVTSAKTTPVQENNSKNTGNVTVIFTCEVCNFESKDRNNIEQHKKDKHEKKFSCHKCEFTALKLEDLKTHKFTEHPQVMHHCQYCDFESVHENQLKKHIKINHLIEFECRTCAFRAKNDHDLHIHITNKHPLYYSCDTCSYKAFSKSDLNRHIRVMHGERSYQPRYFKPSQQYNHANPTHRHKPKETQRETQKKALKETEKEVHTTINDEAEQIQQKILKCVGECDSLQKTFTHEDELDVHMKFYHKTPLPQ